MRLINGRCNSRKGEIVKNGVGVAFFGVGVVKIGVSVTKKFSTLAIKGEIGDYIG